MDKLIVIVITIIIINGLYHYVDNRVTNMEDKEPNPYSDGYEEFCDVFIGDISLKNNGEHFTFYTDNPNELKLPIKITCKGLDEYPTDNYKVYIDATSPYKKSALFDIGNFKHKRFTKDGKTIDEWIYYSNIYKEDLFEFNLTGTYKLKFKIDGDKLYYPAKIDIKWDKE